MRGKAAALELATEAPEPSKYELTYSRTNFKCVMYPSLSLSCSRSLLDLLLYEHEIYSSVGLAPPTPQTTKKSLRLSQWLSGIGPSPAAGRRSFHIVQMNPMWPQLFTTCYSVFPFLCVVLLCIEMRRATFHRFVLHCLALHCLQCFA